MAESRAVVGRAVDGAAKVESPQSTGLRAGGQTHTHPGPATRVEQYLFGTFVSVQCLTWHRLPVAATCLYGQQGARTVVAHPIVAFAVESATSHKHTTILCRLIRCGTGQHVVGGTAVIDVGNFAVLVVEHTCAITYCAHMGGVSRVDVNIYHRHIIWCTVVHFLQFGYHIVLVHVAPCLPVIIAQKALAALGAEQASRHIQTAVHHF